MLTVKLKEICNMIKYVINDVYKLLRKSVSDLIFL